MIETCGAETIIVYAAESKPMPIRAFLLYLSAKYKERTQITIWQNYIADCLWAQATGRTFSDKDNNATLLRWHEIVNPKKEQTAMAITKEGVKAQFLRLKTR